MPDEWQMTASTRLVIDERLPHHPFTNRDGPPLTLESAHVLLPFPSLAPSQCAYSGIELLKFVMIDVRFPWRARIQPIVIQIGRDRGDRSFMDLWNHESADHDKYESSSFELSRW